MRAAPILLLLCAGCIEPGFAPDATATGPSLTVRADVAKSDATLHIDAASLGERFGLSYHVTVDRRFVDVGRVDQPNILGDTDAKHLANTNDGDIALGGTRVSLDVGAVAVSDGEIATITLRGVAPGTSSVSIVDAVARD